MTGDSGIGNAEGRPPLDDEALLAALRAAVAQADPVPPSVLAAARGSLVWRTIDAELAELVEDSALAPLTGVRSESGPRLLTFEAGDSAVVVEVTARGAVRRLIGQLIDPVRATVEVRHSTGSTTAEADDLGRFTVETGPGPVSLAWQAPGAPHRRLVTAWVTV